MSAPQAGNQNGKPPKPPAPFLRRSTAGSPFVQRRRPPPSRPAQGALSAAGFSSAGFSSAAARKGNVPNGAPPAGATAQFGAAPSGYSLPRFDALRAQFGGWTEPPPPGVPYTDYPLRTTKKELRDGMRFHVMRLMRSKVGPGEKPVDPTDQTEFTRPVSLHRRDPRQPPLGRAVKEEDQNAGRPPPAPIDEKEAERLAQLKAEKEAQRAADLAQIAPVQREPKPKVQTQQKKKEKLTQITTQPRTEESRKEAELRYEEALPWHLEDADGKNVWVGSYVAALSETNVALVVDNESSAFRMIPLEKWYRFTAKPPFNPYSIEEAEKLMSKRVDVGRWVMRDKEKEREQKEMEEMRKYIHGPTKIKTESSTFRAASRSEKMDVDDVDISGDEFQDDDEAPYEQVEVDEDEKDARERIRREQLGANLFGDADEREVEKEEEDAKKEELQRKLFGKKMKKALTRRENQLIYESDSSEADPFASSSVSRDHRPGPGD